MIALDIAPKTTLSLESQMRHLAMESSFADNVLSVFRDVVPNLAGALRSAFSNLRNTHDITPEVVAIQKTFKLVDGKIPNAKYLNYTSMLVSVPEGFKGSLLEYVLFLENISDDLFRDTLQTIGEYNVVLATFISDKDSKTALKDHSALFARVAERREKITGGIKKFFPGTATISKQKFGEVIARFGEIEQIVKVVEKIERSRKQHNLNEVAAAVQKATDMLDVIVKDIETNGVTNVSGNSAMNISQGAFELGKYVELVALYRSLVEQATATVLKLTEQLDRAL